MQFGNPRFKNFQPPKPREISPEDGLLLIDKPAGPSSHDVVGAIRKHFGFQKVGHGGTLDPGATGLLLILVGRGTSLSNQVMGCDKRYTGEMLVGTETNTQDLEGDVVAELPYDLVTPERLREEAARLEGDIYQTPPMASAVKVGGVPLYKLQRKGQEVEREPRLVHIYRYAITGYDAPVAAFDITCGKGTYIRTLCHDLWRALGCGACMKSLRRVKCGSWSVTDAIGFDAALALTRDALLARIIPMHNVK
ncbi:MAG: tRNA pseudouridine(55) synthase TruB [Kiritimatiellae bacterium]|nr:tRNA pseudouridine(55) synthase TruB [Kiritimatiellia bacterium]